MDVIGKIVGLQTEQGLSNNALASISGLSQSTVQSVIKRGMLPTLPTLEKLCSALGISLAEFFAEDTQVDPEEARLLSAFRALDDEQKPLAIRLVETL